MTVTETIMEHVKILPEPIQIEVLDFIEYLETKKTTREDKNWNTFSLSQAMRGMGDEQISFTVKDLQEAFS